MYPDSDAFSPAIDDHLEALASKLGSLIDETLPVPELLIDPRLAAIREMARAALFEIIREEARQSRLPGQ